MATPSKKVCRVRSEKGRIAGRSAQPMGLLAEMEVGSEDVLSKVNGEVAEQHVEGRTGRSFQHLGHHSEHSDGEHESGTEREAGVNEPEAPPEMPDHRQGADHVSQCRRQPRTRAGSPASPGRSQAETSRVLRLGSSSTRSSSVASISPMRGPCDAQILKIGPADGQVRASQRISPPAYLGHRADPRRLAAVTEAARERTGRRPQRPHRPASGAPTARPGHGAPPGLFPVAAARAISAFDALRRRSTATGSRQISAVSSTGSRESPSGGSGNALCEATDDLPARESTRARLPHAPTA